MQGSEDRFSRREFLKAIGIVTGGAALGSLALLMACQWERDSSTPGTLIPTTSTTGTPPPTASISTPIGTTGATAPTISISTPLGTAGTPSPTVPIGEVYVPPAESPPLINIYGCLSKVASDRWYNNEHTWIKELGNGKVVIGISDKMQEMTSVVTRFSYFYKEGAIIRQGDAVASVEAHKLNTDICAPVSGVVTQTNTHLILSPGSINTHPYTLGWMAVIQLADPREIGELFGPNHYAYLQAQGLPSTVSPPPQHS